MKVSPSLPGLADSASRLSSSRPTPRTCAVATRLRAPFRVQTRGMNSPVASANPATVPVGSWVWLVLRVNAVPLVPRETTAAPADTPRPRPAAMLSPVPGGQGHTGRGVADDLGRGGHPRQFELVAESPGDQVLAILVGGGVEVAGARGVPAVGGRREAACRRSAR